jgi:hypothetical protein
MIMKIKKGRIVEELVVGCLEYLPKNYPERKEKSTESLSHDGRNSVTHFPKRISQTLLVSYFFGTQISLFLSPMIIKTVQLGQRFSDLHLRKPRKGKKMANALICLILTQHKYIYLWFIITVHISFP